MIGPRLFRLGQSASTFYGTRRFPTFDTATRNGCCDRVLFVCLFVFCLCAYLFLGKGQTVRGQSPLAISKHDRYFNISIFGFLFRCVRFEGTVFFLANLFLVERIIRDESSVTITVRLTESSVVRRVLRNETKKLQTKI